MTQRSHHVRIDLGTKWTKQREGPDTAQRKEGPVNSHGLDTVDKERVVPEEDITPWKTTGQQSRLQRAREEIFQAL